MMRNRSRTKIGAQCADPCADPCATQPSMLGDYSIELICTMIIKILAAVTLVFAILAWMEARDASDFAYNGEDWLFREGGPRGLARRTCLPFYSQPLRGDLVFNTAVAAQGINTLLTPAEHLELCLPGDIPDTTCAKLAPLDLAELCAADARSMLVDRVCECEEAVPTPAPTPTIIQ